MTGVQTCALPIWESAGGIGIRGTGGEWAGWFQGDVRVTGNLTVEGDIFLTGADCAEHFDVADGQDCNPGTVMVISNGGALEPSSVVYDRRVAGVVSGAGAFRPGLILDKRPSPTSRRLPIALIGKAYCKVDAQYGEIEIGDMLTTSPTPGHAMKATDPHRSFGAVIGKALKPMKSRTGLVPILIFRQ